MIFITREKTYFTADKELTLMTSISYEKRIVHLLMVSYSKLRCLKLVAFML